MPLCLVVPDSMIAFLGDTHGYDLGLAMFSVKEIS